MELVLCSFKNKHLVSFFNHEIQDVYLYLDDIAKQETHVSKVRWDHQNSKLAQWTVTKKKV